MKKLKNLKKYVTKPNLIALGLGVTCIAVLIGVIFLNKSPEREFVPDPTSQIPTGSEWEEPGKLPMAISGDNAPAPGIEEYEEGEVIETDLTDVDLSRPPEPDPPEAKGDLTDPNATPEYDEDQLNPSGAGPEHGSTNENGQIYDPVFGWITPQPSEEVPTDNNGDPDKQVGTM